VLERAVEGRLRSLAFALPAGVSWPLPLYELALLTWAFLRDRCTMGVELTLATSEDAPLGLFGVQASEAIRTLLRIRGIALRLRETPLRFEQGELRFDGHHDALTVSAVVALPRLEGPRLSGIPHDRNGFVPTDEHGRVGAEVDIYAVGDLTHFPLKQGGIATQQADTAAAHIASRAGADVEPTPFRPVLRGLLLTGLFPRYLRTDAESADSVVSTEPLWWPPAKIVGHYLAPFLATRLGLPQTPPNPSDADIQVELKLSASTPRYGHDRHRPKPP
jgi:sulfide:quinone oxidoreductase